MHSSRKSSRRRGATLSVCARRTTQRSQTFRCAYREAAKLFKARHPDEHPDEFDEDDQSEGEGDRESADDDNGDEKQEQRTDAPGAPEAGAEAYVS